MMRVGITILPEYPWPEAEARFRAAEELGFDDAWTFDHLGFGALLDAPWYGAIPTLAAAAAATRRIRLGTLVSTPNFRHPVSFARDLIALDNVSNGRFTCGLGSGSKGYDTRVLGAQGRVTHRGRRFAEFVELLDLLLRTDNVTWHGEFYEVIEARTLPGCRQQPRLPFAIAANGPRAMEVAAQFGEGWVTDGGGGHARLDDWWSAVAALAERFTAPGRRRILQTDEAPVYALSSVECFLEFLGRAEALGFTDIAVPWPRSSEPWAGRQSMVEQVAAARPPADGDTPPSTNQ
jgi:alkanesulfonate monooxygenase SsuD/methylene tetrahydromethanopterin reductase-like flavin-dependent oxidoreductase (luciferase family)